MIRTSKAQAPMQTLVIGEVHLVFDAKSRLVEPAATPHDTDKWEIRLSCNNKGPQTFNYQTGVGHRIMLTDSGFERPNKRFSGHTVWDFDHSRPRHPDARDVLICLGSDASTAIEMPRDDASAMDYLQAEFGHEDKASDLLRLVRALRSNADKLDLLLRGTGVTLEAFAVACQELDQ